MAKPLVIVGAGGFGREVIDVVRAVNEAADEPLWELLGVVDRAPSDINRNRLATLGVRHLGGLDRLSEMRGASVLIGVGMPTARAEIARLIDRAGLSSPSLVHPTAVVGSECQVADGIVVCAHVVIGTNVGLGRHAHLNPHAVIGHDSVLRDFVSVNPNATISGDCFIEDRVLVGAGAVVLEGLRVGRCAVVGGSACVVRDVTPGTVVKGVPAR